MVPSNWSELSRLTGARQTMLSWARVVESYEAVPEVYKASCHRVLADRQPFPHVVLAPGLGGLRHKTTEKLLCETGGIFYIWEHTGNKVVTTAYPLKAIHDLELGIVLLYSWMMVSGVTLDGTVASTKIEFNTATARHLVPFISKMRPMSSCGDEAGLKIERARFNYLSSASFKFMNYARDSLLHGERVIHTVWQPKIRAQIGSLLGHPLYRTICLEHLAVLTDKEVIFISDDERSSESRGVRYGGVWRYIPLRTVDSVWLAAHGDDGLALSLHLSPGDRRIDKFFSVPARCEVERFQAELERLIAKR